MFTMLFDCSDGFNKNHARHGNLVALMLLGNRPEDLMRISEFCQGNVISIDQNESLESAARLMERFSVGALVVSEHTSDSNRYVGMITDRDIVTKAVALSLNMKTAKVSDVMSTRLVCAEGDTDILEVMRLMEDKHVRRILILGADTQALGVVATDDIICFVGNVMQRLSDLYRRQIGTSSRRQTRDYTKMA